MKKTSKQKAFTLLVNRLKRAFVKNHLFKCTKHRKYHLHLGEYIAGERLLIDSTNCDSYEFNVLTNLQFIEVINILRVKLDEEKET